MPLRAAWRSRAPADGGGLDERVVCKLKVLVPLAVCEFRSSSPDCRQFGPIGLRRLRSNSRRTADLNLKLAGETRSEAKTEIWLPLADALRNFVFDPTPDFVAWIHGLRADPLPGIRAG